MYKVAVQLQKLGLCKYKSKALAYIIKNPECTARDVSNGANIPYTKVYAVIDALEDMNFVNSGLGRPKRHVASDPNYVIDFLIKREKDRYREIRNSGRKALEIIAAAT